jgi:hypothetical protein
MGAGRTCLRRPDVAGYLGLSMSLGLIWRAFLFVGLTAGYTILSALPYLS